MRVANHSNLLWVLCVLVAACGDDEGDLPSGQASTSEPGPSLGEIPEDPELEQAEERAAAHREALRASRVHLDLMEIGHLADVEHQGLFVDFGTPARMKYTGGSWRNQWGSDGAAGERTFTRLGTAAKLTFHLDEPESLTLRLRLRKVGTPNIVVYLNGETLRTVELNDGVGSYDVSAPRDHTRRGENELRIRATETRERNGEAVSIELDSVRVVEGSIDEDAIYVEPVFARMTGQVRLGEEESQLRDAISVDVNTTLSYYVDVPEDAKLSFGIGSVDERRTAKVRVRPADGEAEELWSGPIPQRYQDELVSLEPYAGKIVRLDFVTEGEPGSEIGWSRPQIVVPLPSQARVPEEARNVVVLTIDTLRASKLRPYNRRSRVQTPILSAVAEDATLFEAAQSPENWTKPSVASILTSLTPMTHGTKQDAASLPREALMVSEVFQEAGFETGTFLANGYVSDRFGFAQGWDHYTNYIREERNTSARNVFKEAAEWIEEHKDERFFAYIQTIDPHVPYDPPDEFLAMYDEDHRSYTGQVRNRMTGPLLGDAKRNPPRVTFTESDKARLRDLHDAEISYHDRYFGVFIEKLKELGLYEDMIFVITSDHGEEFEEHGSWGHGHSVYQELLHVPLIVRWPAAEARGLRVASTVSTMDISPTVLEASGVAIPEVFEGRSLLGYLRDQPPAGPAVAFSDFLDDRRVIRAGRYKLILRGNLSWTMFDLETDPGEERQLDRTNANPVALRYLRILLGEFLGAEDRRLWWLRGDGGANRVLPQEDSQIDAELCRQLLQLQYVDPRCEDLL
ncbi:MAG: sulfatase [Myxococcota bacterium]